MVYSDDYDGTCMDELNRRITPKSDETMQIAGTDILQLCRVESYPDVPTRNRSNSDEYMIARNIIESIFRFFFIFFLRHVSE